MVGLLLLPRDLLWVLLWVSWVRFDTGTPLAANQGLQRAVEEPALVAGQRTAAKPRVKSNPLFSGSGIGIVLPRLCHLHAANRVQAGRVKTGSPFSIRTVQSAWWIRR